MFHGLASFIRKRLLLPLSLLAMTFIKDKRGTVDRRGLVITLVIGAAAFFAFFWLELAIPSQGPLEQLVWFVIPLGTIAILVFYAMGKRGEK